VTNKEVHNSKQCDLLKQMSRCNKTIALQKRSAKVRQTTRIKI
jgi:hypothetical protein